MLYQAMDLAKYTINYCIDNEQRISNLKLQKLLYYLWIEYYKRNNEYVFNDLIFAWAFGPVIPDVYFEYCPYGGIQIGKQNLEDMNFSDEQKTEINDCINRYISCPASTLVEMSHQKNKPWDVIYNQENKHKNIIPFELIIQRECAHI